MSVFDALGALRDAADPSHPALGWAWREVATFIDTRLRRPGSEHDDIRQRTLIKVMKGVRRLAADSPAGAESWLRQVHRSAVAEHHRKIDPATLGLGRGGRDEDAVPLVERLAAPVPERTEEDVAVVDALEEGVMELVEAWLAANVTRPSKRVGDRQRAHVAWMANVLGQSVEAIAAELGLTQSRDTLYKWIERGREQVLLPVIVAWEADVAGSPEAAMVPRELRRVLEATRRADAGKPRPDRRSVSREDEAPSDGSKAKGARGSNR